MEQVNQAIDTSYEAIRHASLASKGIPPKPVISNPIFSGLYEEGHGGYYLWNVSDWNSFTDRWDELAKDNLRLIDLNTIQDGDIRWFIGTWIQGTGGYALLRSSDWKVIYNYGHDNARSLKPESDYPV